MNIPVDLLMATIEKEVLPLLNLGNRKVRSVLAYGSRAAGLGRKDSDIDVSLILESVPKGVSFITHSQSISLDGESVVLDMKVFSAKSFDRFLNSDVLFNIGWTQILFDPEAVAAKALERHESRWQREVLAHRNYACSLSDESVYGFLLSYLKDAVQSLYDLSERRDFVALGSRLFEFNLTLYVHAATYELGKIFPVAEDSLPKEWDELVRNVLLLQQPQHSKHMTLHKYSFRDWFRSDSQRLSETLQISSIGSTAVIESFEAVWKQRLMSLFENVPRKSSYTFID